jgi:GNAT superfamily N-acetyltransferase
VIRPLADDDLSQALPLAEEAVGTGWVTADDLTPGPGRRVVVAEVDGRVVGVASGRLDGPGALIGHRHAAVREAMRAALAPGDRTLLLLDLAAVAPGARGRGLYRALLDDRIARGAREGAALAVAFGWTPPDGCHIAPAMERGGFTARAEVAGFFRDASVAADARCPACGPPPCGCSAVLFVRRIAPGR